MYLFILLATKQPNQTMFKFGLAPASLNVGILLAEWPSHGSTVLYRADVSSSELITGVKEDHRRVDQAHPSRGLCDHPQGLIFLSLARSLVLSYTHAHIYTHIHTTPRESV